MPQPAIATCAGEAEVVGDAQDGVDGALLFGVFGVDGLSVVSFRLVAVLAGQQPAAQR